MSEETSPSTFKGWLANSVVAPLVVALVIGVGSAAVGYMLTTQQMDLRIKQLERDIKQERAEREKLRDRQEQDMGDTNRSIQRVEKLLIRMDGKIDNLGNRVEAVEKNLEKMERRRQ